MLNFYQKTTTQPKFTNSIMEALVRGNQYPLNPTKRNTTNFLARIDIKNTTKKITPIQQKNLEKRKKYFLGSNYPDIYFTQQKIRCMAYFLRGMNNREIAKEMEISEHVGNPPLK